MMSKDSRIHFIGDPYKNSSRTPETGNDAMMADMTRRTNRHLKICILIATIVVVIATVAGVAFYLTMAKISSDEKQTLNVLKDIEDLMAERPPPDGAIILPDENLSNNQPSGSIVNQFMADVNSFAKTAEVKPIPVRLSGGGSDQAGRVMVQVQGEWGTICGKGWSDKEANTVCRILGFTHGQLTSSSNFSSTNAPVLMSDLTCPEDAGSLYDCKMSMMDDVDASCTHHHDAAVTCSNGAAIKPEAHHYYYYSCWQIVGCDTRRCWCLYPLYYCPSFINYYKCLNLLTTTSTSTTTTTTTTTTPSSTTIGPIVSDPPMFRYKADTDTKNLEVLSSGEYLPFMEADTNVLANYICPAVVPAYRSWTVFECVSANYCNFWRYSYVYDVFNFYQHCPNLPADVAQITESVEYVLYYYLYYRLVIVQLQTDGTVIIYQYRNYYGRIYYSYFPISYSSATASGFTYICNVLLGIIGTTTASPTTTATPATTTIVSGVV